MSTPDELRKGRVAEAIRGHRLVCVLRRIEPAERLVALVDELADAGARIFELTFDSPSAADDVRWLRSRLAERGDGDFLTGAGTVLSADLLAAARDAGADFLVSPLLDERLVADAIAAGLPFVPGALTPTEIARAWAAGATFVKVFPASAIGPAFVRELRGPMPDVQLIPTGGVDAGNALGFLEAGAAAVGMGGALVRAEAGARAKLVRSIAGGR